MSDQVPEYEDLHRALMESEAELIAAKKRIAALEAGRGDFVARDGSYHQTREDVWRHDVKRAYQRISDLEDDAKAEAFFVVSKDKRIAVQDERIIELEAELVAERLKRY